MKDAVWTIVADPATSDPPAGSSTGSTTGSPTPVFIGADGSSEDRAERRRRFLDGEAFMSKAKVGELLGTAVSIATSGAADKGRPGQVKLLDDVWSAMRSRGHLIGQAPTGTGKSLAYGTAAAAAAVHGQRTVISTESLALQAQLIDKDLPTVAQAIEKETGLELSFAVLKGRSNFACATAAIQAAHRLLREAGIEYGADTGSGGSDDPMSLVDLIDSNRPAFRKVKRLNIGGIEVKALDLAEALVWALPVSIGLLPETGEEPEVGHLVGDFDSAGERVTDAARPLLSATSDSCLGQDHCEFFDRCRAESAKGRAARADIVVTNHAMIGVQATKAIPVVIGSEKLGAFDHIVVDEAHALPGVVRSQGATALSGVALRRLAIACTADTGIPQAQSDAILGGRRTFDRLDRQLLALAERLDKAAVATGDPIVLKADFDPIGSIAEDLTKWLTSTRTALNSNLKVLNETAVGGFSHQGRARSRSRDRLIATRKALARLSAMAENLEHAIKPDPGVARWMEVSQSRGDKVASVELSPVNVAPQLDRNVWTGYFRFDADDEKVPVAPGAEGSEESDLTVVAVSATVPDTFAREAGVDGRPQRYESPFADAYRSSRLYLPALSQSEAAEVVTARPGSRPRFNIQAHQQWALGQIEALVEANGGSALVLAATTAAGRAYADALRSTRSPWQIHSQWDPGMTGQIVARWRADETSVMVGTRSMFTGVDAPGDTNTLVIVDRVPRARMNPVDDARRDGVAFDLELDKWTADTHVYVADAAVTLEQGVGRLIRSVGDCGLVAVLDPRFGGGAVPQLNRGAVAAYRKAVSAFPEGRWVSDLGSAVRFLQERRSNRATGRAGVA